MNSLYCTPDRAVFVLKTCRRKNSPHQGWRKTLLVAQRYEHQTSFFLTMKLKKRRFKRLSLVWHIISMTRYRATLARFRCRTSNEFNFNIQSQLPTFLYAVKYNSTCAKRPAAIFWLIHKCNVNTYSNTSTMTNAH